MPKRGKNYKAAVAAYNKAELFEAKDALKVAVENAKAKFLRISCLLLII